MALKSVFMVTGAIPLLFSTPAAAQTNKEPPPSSVAETRTPQQNENYERGEKIARDLGYFDVLPLEPEKQGPKGGFTQFTLEHLMPNVYGRPGLSLKERELVVISIIITQGNPAGLMWHFREVAPKLGISERELREVLYISCFYAGWPKCSYATNELGKVVMGPNKWPKELLMEPPKDEPAIKPKP